MSVQSSQTPTKEKILGKVLIGHFFQSVDRKRVLPILTWKNTITDPLVIEQKIVEVIREVPVEVIREVVKEAKMEPVERVAKNTMTDVKLAPKYTISSFAEFQIKHIEKISKITMTDKKPTPNYSISTFTQIQRVKPSSPPPKPKQLISIETQTVFLPPYLVTQNQTTNLSIFPRSAALSPIVEARKVFNLKYEGTANPSSKPASNQASPNHDKIQRRLQIYEDQNVKLQMEIDTLKNKHNGLYSKLNEKSFESTSHYQVQVDQLKKENIQLKQTISQFKSEIDRIKELSQKEFNDKLVRLSNVGKTKFRVKEI